MGISEKLGYVRGLADGLGIKDKTPEGRLTLAMIDLLSEMAGAMEEMGLMVQDLEESVDDIFCDMCGDEDDDEDDDDSHIRFFPGAHDNDNEEDAGDDDGDPSCVSCGAPVAITREVLLEGRVTCPQCGQQMALDIQGDHECSCGHCGCGHSHEDEDDQE